MLLRKKVLGSLEFIILAVSIVIAGSNEDIIKSYHSKEIGKGVYLNQIFEGTDINGVYRGLKIQVQNNANYYISSWIQGLMGTTVDVFIDGQSMGKIALAKDGWQASSVLGTSKNALPTAIYLSIGIHTIIFRGKGPGVPDVEFVRLGASEADAFISDTTFQNKLAAIKAYAASHTVQVKDDTADVSKIISGRAMAASAPNDPVYDYVGLLNQPFSYTYRGSFYFYQGNTVKFEVKNATTQYVLYLFKTYNTTSTTSWAANNTSLTVTIPGSDNYTLLVRAYWTGNRGTGNLYYNNALYQINIIIAGTYYAADLTKSGSLNYFTAKPESSPLSIDTYILLSTFRNGTPVAAWNDDYSGSGDFYWGYLSRIKFDLAGWYNPYNRAYIFGSAYASYEDGNCDFYLCNSFSDIPSYQMPDNTKWFPSLYVDDAIKSATSSGAYNCISWSGGVTSNWYWPPNSGSLWYNPDPKVAFNNFYANNPPRYAPGAWNYTPNGATAQNSVVDLWKNTNQPYDGGYTHGSVKKPGNDHNHGYDWESKPGGFTRTFHPRYDLNNMHYCWDPYYQQYDYGYGNVSDYYISTGTKTSSTKTLPAGVTIETSQDAITAGTSEIRSVSLDENERYMLSKRISQVDTTVIADFNSKYGAWKETWTQPQIKLQSNPRAYALSAQYRDFIAFCKAMGKASWPLVINKLAQGDFFAINAIEDLMYPGNQSLMDAVRQENIASMYKTDGTYMIATLDGNWLSFCKKLMAQEW